MSRDSTAIHGSKRQWMRISPLAADSTELIDHFYFADTSESAEAARARTIETNCAIARQDFSICEHSQRNLASDAYRPGPLRPKQEQAVAWFQEKVAAAAT